MDFSINKCDFRVDLVSTAMDVRDLEGLSVDEMKSLVPSIKINIGRLKGLSEEMHENYLSLEQRLLYVEQTLDDLYDVIKYINYEDLKEKGNN